MKPTAARRQTDSSRSKLAFLRDHPVIPLAVIFTLAGIAASGICSSPWAAVAILGLAFIVVVATPKLREARGKIDRIFSEELDK